jgi:transcriptional regulator with XRE-family HTH domain
MMILYYQEITMQPFSSKKLSIDADNYKQEVDVQLIADKLSALLESKKITTKILSNATGISIAAINNLKRGEGNPTLGTLNAISNFFCIPLGDLLGLGNYSNMQSSSTIIDIYDLRNADQRNESNIASKMLIETPKNINKSDLFGIVINNNYLFPLYEKGSIFILTTSRETIDGDIVLVRVQNSVNAIKRVFLQKDLCYLKNINIDETLESYNKNDISIIGVVIQIIQQTS